MNGGFLYSGDRTAQIPVNSKPVPRPLHLEEVQQAPLYDADPLNLALNDQRVVALPQTRLHQRNQDDDGQQRRQEEAQ
ncbi:MAG: hypothetical protein F4181_02845 [Proteobacteria bacterium]|nr:hypothetical protein [Pseudomonadota bacterium]